MYPHPLLLLTCALHLSTTAAWGTLGHETVALIAQNFLSPAAVKYSQGILHDTSSLYLANVSTWADSYRSSAEGKFSAPYHYIDAEDSPPSSCGVDLQRDCGAGGCVVSAIANYTTRVKDTTLSAAERFKALKFIVHFVGDVHQPLHDEALAVGGNKISVKFNGATTNLHHIWDTELPEKIVGGRSSMAKAQSWAASLTASVKNGVYAAQKANWLGETDIRNPSGSAMSWARDSNAYVCSTVLPNGVPAVENQELSGAYYNSSSSVVELQITKAGYRLAAWLNLIATGDIGLSAAKGPQKREPLSYLPPGQTNDFSPAKLARRAFGHQC